MKKTTLFIIICFVFFTTNAQTLFHKYMYPSKTSRISFSYPKLLGTNDNGYILAQTWPKRSNDSLTNILQLQKLDKNGVIKKERDLLWDVSTPEVVPCSDGNLILLGTTKINGVSKVNAIKMNSSGNILWTKDYYSDSLALDVAGVFQNSNKLMIGSSNRDIRNADMWWTNAGIMTIDYNTGNFLNYNIYASKTYTQDSNQRVLGLLPKKDGGFIYYGIDNFNYPFLMRFNSNGNLLWAKYVILNGSSSDIKGIAETSDGGLVICGGGSRAVVFKTDASGNLLWSKQYTSQFYLSDRNEWFSKVVINSNGSMFITGEVWKDDIGRYINVIVKMDGGGNILWSKYDSVSYYADFNSLVLNKSENRITGCDKSLLDPRAQFGATNIMSFDTLGNSCSTMKNLTFTSANFPYTTGNYPLQKTLYAGSITTSNFPLSNSDLGNNIIVEACTNSNISNTIEQKQYFTVTLVSNILSNNYLNLKLTSDVNTQAEILIKGLNGEVFTKQSIFITKGSAIKNITMPNLLPGIYFVQVANATENHSVKFYKN